MKAQLDARLGKLIGSARTVALGALRVAMVEMTDAELEAIASTPGAGDVRSDDPDLTSVQRAAWAKWRGLKIDTIWDAAWALLTDQERAALEAGDDWPKC